MNKYHNQKTIVNGINFDSKREANRYCELRLLEKAGVIKYLELQPRFLLQPSFRKNRKLHRKIEYIADFSYVENNNLVVEDVKGVETEVFKLKRKMFEYRYPEYELKIIK